MSHNEVTESLDTEQLRSPVAISTRPFDLDNVEGDYYVLVHKLSCRHPDRSELFCPCNPAMFASRKFLTTTDQ